MRQTKKKATRRQVQLEMFPEVVLPAPVTGLWKEVEGLPAKAARLELERRKLVQLRMSQAELLNHGSRGNEGEPPAVPPVPYAPESARTDIGTRVAAVTLLPGGASDESSALPVHLPSHADLRARPVSVIRSAGIGSEVVPRM